MIVSAIFNSLENRADLPVLSDMDESLTGRQLLDQASSVAQAMVNHGVQPGDRVAICLRRNLEGVVAVLACWKAAATPVILDFRQPAVQRAQMIRDFGLSLFIEDRHPPGNVTYESVIWDSNWRFGRQLALDISAYDFAAFLATSSGTTGFPKAYVQSQDNIAGRIIRRASLGVHKEGLVLSPMTLAFSATRTIAILGLYSGWEVRFFPMLYSTGELIEGLLSNRATITALPPPVIRKIVLEAGERKSHLFPDLKVLRSTGGPASAEDKIAAYRNLCAGYQMSYGSSLASAATVLQGDDILKWPETAGRILEDVKIEILDPTTRDVLPLGQTGLIKVWSPSVATDILGQGITDEEFGDGWGIPGDFGFVNEANMLTITGRQSDVILRGGVNVAPQEIENTLKSQPGVQDAGVVGVDDDELGQEVAAFIVAKELTEQDVHAFCMQNVAPEKRPRIIRLLPSLPYNVNGKLDRRSLISKL